MCCLFAVLAFAGPRAALILYWLLYPASWRSSRSAATSGARR